jgi:hypothetical protein
MWICFTCDLHGDLGLYEQLEELLRVETPDLLILGGDLLIDGDPQDPLGTQVVFLQRELMPRITRWRAASPRLNVACLVGNHEWACTQAALQAHHQARRVILLDHRRAWVHEGLSLLGYPSTPPTPHWVKDFERLDLPGDPLPEFEGLVWDPARQRVRAADLQRHFGDRPTIAHELAQAAPVADPWILVAHAPPHNTRLDRLSKVPYPIGSRAVRQFVEQRQPMVALHGHVHESPEVTGRFADRVGQTLCINPGQGHQRLHAVVFDMERPAHTLLHTVYGAASGICL